MIQWPSEKFNGDRSSFREPYLENLKQQLRAAGCYRIASGEEKMPIEMANLTNTNELKLQDKKYEWERKNMLGFAIITMSVESIILSKINKSKINTCCEAFAFLETTYGGALTVAEMAHIDRLLDKNILPTESAEVFIERWLQLSVQSGIERNVVNDVRVLARLTKLFESTNKFPNAIKLCYLTNQNLNETIALIIKEDEKDKLLIKLNTDTTKVTFKEKEDIPSIMKIDQPNNNSNNNTYNKNKHNRSTQRDRSYNKSDRSYSRDRSFLSSK